MNNKRMKTFNRVYRILGAVFLLMLLAALIMCMLDMPDLFTDSIPGENTVAERYIESGIEETGAVNFVAGMILDYRAFDTFGESNVLFVATICVTIMLRIDSKNRKKDDDDEEDEDEGSDMKLEPVRDSILKTCSKLIIPIILVYGIYVVLNGHLSPGGGFSGGAVLGAGFILYLNAFGFEKTQRFMNKTTVKWITFGSLLVYCLAKSYSFFTGANGLESGIPLGTPGAILSSGLILILNICVGFVVACTMYSFYALVRRGRI